jgi:hypothetical protein
MKFLGSMGLILLAVGLISCDLLLGKPDSRPIEPDLDRDVAFSYEPIIEGKPDSVLYSLYDGYIVWKTGNTFHVRIIKDLTSEENFKVFYSGNIRISNAIINRPVIKYESRYSRIFDKEHDISYEFDFFADERSSDRGFDFSLTPLSMEYCVTFDLLINGTISPNRIRLGSSFQEPRMIPLSVCFRQ